MPGQPRKISAVVEVGVRDDHRVQVTRREVGNTLVMLAVVGGKGVVVKEVGAKFNVEEQPEVSVKTI